MKSLFLALYLIAPFCIFSQVDSPIPPETPSKNSSISHSRTISIQDNKEGSECTFSYRKNVHFDSADDARIETEILNEILGSTTNNRWEQMKKKQGFRFNISNNKLTGRAWSKICDQSFIESIELLSDQLCDI